MKPPSIRDGNVRWGAGVLCALCLALLAIPASAHQAFMLVRLSDDGNLIVETGFSDGSTGAGLPLVLDDRATGVMLNTYVVNEDGVTVLPVPDVPYTVTFDGGPGHRVSKDGPMPETPRNEEPGAFTLINVLQGDPSQLKEAETDSIAEADIVICFDRMARRLADLLSNATVVVVDDSVPLGSSHEDAAHLRERVAARIEEGMAAGRHVAVLVEGPVDTSADWAWLAAEHTP